MMLQVEKQVFNLLMLCLLPPLSLTLVLQVEEQVFSLMSQCLLVLQVVEQVFSLVSQYLLPPLSAALKKAMKDTFGDLWLSLVVHKPPWITLYHVLFCFNK